METRIAKAVSSHCARFIHKGLSSDIPFHIRCIRAQGLPWYQEFWLNKAIKWNGRNGSLINLLSEMLQASSSLLNLTMSDLHCTEEILRSCGSATVASFAISFNGSLQLQMGSVLAESSCCQGLRLLPRLLVTSLIWVGHRSAATKWSFLPASTGL